MNPEEFGCHNTRYVSAPASVAHTYGNLLATAQKWVIDALASKIKFKTVHVSSKIAHRQILNTPHEYIKKAKPIITFRPRISYNENTFLKGTLMVERQGGPLTSRTPGTIHLNPFFFDGEKFLECEFSETRRVLFVDVVMSFATLFQQINICEWLLSELPFDGGPFMIPMFLEAYLSPDLMNVVSKIIGIPVHDDKNSVHDFLEYMNSHSYFPVGYKLAGSTGKEEFYRYYKTNVMTSLTDFDRNEGESIGHVMDNYTISFTMRLEFWAPGITYLFSDKIPVSKELGLPEEGMLIPNIVDIFALEDLELNPGWNVLRHCSYRLEKENDEVDFSPMLNESTNEVLNYHLNNGIPVLNFMDIKVRRDGILLPYGKTYTIDYNERKIQFFNKSYGYYTYTVIISVDTNYINALIKEIYKLK